MCFAKARPTSFWTRASAMWSFHVQNLTEDGQFFGASQKKCVQFREFYGFSMFFTFSQCLVLKEQKLRGTMRNLFPQRVPHLPQREFHPNPPRVSHICWVGLWLFGVYPKKLCWKIIKIVQKQSYQILHLWWLKMLPYDFPMGSHTTKKEILTPKCWQRVESSTSWTKMQHQKCKRTSGNGPMNQWNHSWLLRGMDVGSFHFSQGACERVLRKKGLPTSIV